MSGGSPPTKTFREKRSPDSEPGSDASVGEEWDVSSSPAPPSNSDWLSGSMPVKKGDLPGRALTAIRREKGGRQRERSRVGSRGRGTGYVVRVLEGPLPLRLPNLRAA